MNSVNPKPPRRPVTSDDYGYDREGRADFWGSVFYQPLDWVETELFETAQHNIEKLGIKAEYTEAEMVEVFSATYIEQIRKSVKTPVARVQKVSE